MSRGMKDLVRSALVAEAELVVVKVGTRVLAPGPDGRIDRSMIDNLARQIHGMRALGKSVVLVSSGAVGAGLHRLGLDHRPTDVAKLQAVAAVGQAHLLQLYEQSLLRFGLHAAQVLLTAGDLEDRTRYLNVRNTLRTLLEYGAVPIINENDTVAVDELVATFGDNDRLAALVTNLLRAPLMIILSHVDGLLERLADGTVRVVPIVRRFTPQVWGLVQPETSPLGRGGMTSKLEAARIVAAAGENAIIAGGRTPRVLERLMAGEPLGTLILTQRKSIPSRKRWIGFSVSPAGTITVDEGAADAVTRQGGSLLAVGITRVEGSFRKGDVVRITRQDGREIARGLTNYAAGELAKIRGLRSDRFLQVLGHCPYDEVVHRDNLVLDPRPAAAPSDESPGRPGRGSI